MLLVLYVYRNLTKTKDELILSHLQIEKGIHLVLIVQMHRGETYTYIHITT